MKTTDIKLKTSLLALVIATTLLSGCGDDVVVVPEPTPPVVVMQTFTVTVTNLTANQPMSPVVLASHSADAMLWQAGETASLAIEKMAEKLEKGNPVDLVLGALENIRPKIEVKSRRVGGATYQVPIEVPFERQQSLAFRWVVKAASSRKGNSMAESLANELIDAYNNTGSVVKKREETHKMAQANRAFAHLRW